MTSVDVGMSIESWGPARLVHLRDKGNGHRQHLLTSFRPSELLRDVSTHTIVLIYSTFISLRSNCIYYELRKYKSLELFVKRRPTLWGFITRRTTDLATKLLCRQLQSETFLLSFLEKCYRNTYVMCDLLKINTPFTFELPDLTKSCSWRTSQGTRKEHYLVRLPEVDNCLSK